MDMTLVIPFSLVAGAILAVPLTPVFCLLRKVFYVPFIRGRLVQEAEAKGHVVTAQLEKSGELYGTKQNGERVYTNRREGHYRYTYRGRSYRYRYRSTAELPEELILYFLRRPGRACLKRELGAMESPVVKYYVLTMVPAAIAIGAWLLLRGVNVP